MFRAELLVAVVALVACTKPAPPAPVVEASVPSVDAATAALADASSDHGPEAGTSALSHDCDAPLDDPKSAKSIGHTSVVFKLELSNGKKAVFKPHSKKGPNRYKGEIAAFRLATLLDVKHVIPACPRRISKAKMDAALAGRADAAALFSEQAVVEDDSVHGAVMPWVENLGFVELEKEPLASQWKNWLKKGSVIPPDKVDNLAREISMMLVFDYLTANWDRWSGGNVGIDRGTAPLPPKMLFIDNDGAFFENPPKDGLARNKRLLEGAERFPKGIVARLRTLDEDKLRGAFGKDSDGKPLLSEKVIAAVAARAREVIAHIDAKIAQHGEDEVLFFF